jgi:hypothetical protein
VDISKIKSRNLRKYLKLGLKARTLRERYDKKLAALESLKVRWTRAERAAQATWLALNGGQQAAARKLLGQHPVEASSAPVPKRSNAQ